MALELASCLCFKCSTVNTKSAPIALLLGVAFQIAHLISVVMLP